MLERKALPEIDSWLATSGLSSDMQAIFSRLPRLHGSVEILDEAAQLFGDLSQSIQDALAYLQKLANKLQHNFPACELHIDLAELSGYDYHTGIVYGLYTTDSGDEIARGGRYDGVGKLFGQDRPATGFSTDLRKLSQFSQAGSTRKNAIFAPADSNPELEQLISTLRKQGQCVIRQLSADKPQTAKEAACTQQIIQDHDQWVVTNV